MARNAQWFLIFQLLGMHGGQDWAGRRGAGGYSDAWERRISPYPGHARNKCFSLPSSWGMLCAFPWSVGAKSSPKRENTGTAEEQGMVLGQRAQCLWLSAGRDMQWGVMLHPLDHPVPVPRPWWQLSPLTCSPCSCLPPCAAQLTRFLPTCRAPADEDQQDLATETDLAYTVSSPHSVVHIQQIPQILVQAGQRMDTGTIQCTSGPLSGLPGPA